MNRYSVYLLRDGEPPKSLCVGEAGDAIDAVIENERGARAQPDVASASRDTAIIPATAVRRAYVSAEDEISRMFDDSEGGCPD